MGFLGILPDTPSFGTQIARGLGGGLGAGAAQAGEFASQMLSERFKNAMRQKLIQKAYGFGSPTDQSTGDQPVSGPQTSATKMQGSSQQGEPDDFGTARALASIGEHDLARIETDKAKLKTKERAKEKEYTADKTFWDSVHKDRERLPQVKTSLDAEINSILSGKIGPLSGPHWGEIAKGLGAPEALVTPLENPESKSFKTAQKTFIGNTLQDVTRGTTSGKQIELVEGLLAQVGSSTEANLASVWLLQAQHAIKEKKIQLTSQYKKQGISGYEIPDIVSDEIEGYRKQVSDQYIQAINDLVKYGAGHFMGQE